MGIKTVWQTIEMLVKFVNLCLFLLISALLVGLKPSRNDNSNRRSWESSKLSSALEEEEIQENENQTNKENSVSVLPNKSPESVKKDEVEGMFSKYFKKGRCPECMKCDY